MVKIEQALIHETFRYERQIGRAVSRTLLMISEAAAAGSDDVVDLLIPDLTRDLRACGLNELADKWTAAAANKGDA